MKNFEIDLIGPPVFVGCAAAAAAAGAFADFTGYWTSAFTTHLHPPYVCQGLNSDSCTEFQKLNLACCQPDPPKYAVIIFGI
jgi:hypothetical protein